MHVRLTHPLLFNRTGYDRDPVLLPAGDQEASAELVAFVRRNPAVGQVLGDEAPPAAEPVTESPPAKPAGRKGKGGS